ncbi:alpha/beta hydrolase, putative, partial [Hepatocystis sp. ex Piliocolobus tephrosceles]
TDENEFISSESTKNNKNKKYADSKLIEPTTEKYFGDFTIDADNNITDDSNNNPSVDTDIDMKKFKSFNQSIGHIENDEHSNEKSSDILHTKSSRSSLKLEKALYKKSLTWDSNLQSSITYFKEDCPLELFRDA